MSQTARGQRTRDALLLAAESVFGEVGYERASITAITQAAGVAQGTFYVHFPSKHAVFVDLIEDFATRVRSVLSSAVSDIERGTSRAVIERRGLDAFLGFALEHPGLYRVVREAQFVAPDTYRWYYESFVAAYVAGFGRLSPKPRRSVDLEAIGWAMVGLSDVFGLRWVVWEGRLPPPDVMDQLSSLLADGLEGLTTTAKRG